MTAVRHRITLSARRAGLVRAQYSKLNPATGQVDAVGV
jgi:hypothetical protein